MLQISRKFFLAVMLVALAGGATALLVRSGRNPAAVSHAPAQRIRIANIGIYSNYNILADVLGVFRANGLDATVREYDSGSMTMAALASGEADVAIAADFVGVRAMFANQDIRIVATVSSHDVWRVVAKSERVARPVDLKGKRVGLTRATAGEFYLGEFLTANGLRFDDVTMVDLSATDIAARLESGEIDAAMVFEPNATRFSGSRLGFVNWPAQGNRHVLATVYSTRAFIAEHPETIDRYVRALVEVERYQSEHEEEAKRAFASAMKYDESTMRELWSNFTFAVRLDQELLLTMEDQARWNIEHGFVSADRVPNYLGVIHFSALEKANPRAVTVIRR